MAERKLTATEIYAAAVAGIYLGIAAARAKGVVCGSPQNIRVTVDG